MEQPLLVTTEDVVKRLPATVKPLSVDDTTRVATLIEDAELSLIHI